MDEVKVTKSEVCLKTTNDNRRKVLDKLDHILQWCEKWPDGSVNVKALDCVFDDMTDILEELGVEYEYIGSETVD